MRIKSKVQSMRRPARVTVVLLIVAIATILKLQLWLQLPTTIFDDGEFGSHSTKMPPPSINSTEVALQEIVDSSTGHIFHGETIRSFAMDQIFQPGWQTKEVKRETKTIHHSDCSKWAVVTTIFRPSEAIKKAATLPDDWCMVIVADTKTPKDYLQQAAFGKNENSVHFLSVEEQQQWSASSQSKIVEFLHFIPYKHFARKNLGYLYAIQRGAKFIFDFDDDNILHQDETGRVRSPVRNETHINGSVRVALLGKKVLNHHPLMGATIQGSWPRGFPLELVQDNATQGNIAFTSESFEMRRIGVMQFCADENPDIDAIHRLVKPLPMKFISAKYGGTPLLVPSHAFAPYNAQATIHTAQALWATLLPFTVPGRVSDIWRGYFAEALFRDLDLAVAFLPPEVTQDRNEHSYLADMEAELDLYFKAGKLVEFLGGWTSYATTVPERMEALWIQLYERGYIESDDVKLVQLWLGALVEVDYEFPAIKRQRYNNVVLMGQFNYAMDLNSVVFWAQKWREIFRNVVVRGPFSEVQIGDLRSSGIAVYAGDNDRGWYSPMKNLMLTLQEYKKVDGIDGVLYIHDDAYLNVAELTKGKVRFPSQSIIASPGEQAWFPQGYLDARVFNDKSPDSCIYRIHSNGTFSKANGLLFETEEELAKSMPKWRSWLPHCIKPLKKVADNKKSRPFKQKDGSLVIPASSQSDFLFVPTKYADHFAQAAELVVDAKVFLECGVPAIVQFLRQSTNATVTTTLLCTTFLGKRGKEAMLTGCANDPKKMYGVFHPFKISQGLDTWGRLFDFVTYGERFD